jgi:sphingosine kinase
MNYVENCNLSEYSALVAVGGDGTIHEVVNGMLKRQDKLKVPIAMLPNGSGNDACGGIMVDKI